MKIQITALAAGISLMAAAGSANALDWGEVWVGDQAEGEVLIYAQKKLNRKWASSAPKKVIHEHNETYRANNKMHLIGFNNHPGASPYSRAVVAYLGGDIDIYKTRTFSRQNPTKVFSGVAPTSATSLHMCGGSPDNTQMACSSIGGKEIITYSTNEYTDTYTRLGGFALSTMPMSALAPVGTAAAYATLSAGKPICNNYDTSSSYLYVTVNTGGLFILDVSDPSAPEVINAYGPDIISGTGCGLVNDPNGESMWTNAGSNNNADTEQVFNWKFSDIGTSNPPNVVTTLPTIDHGDVHGAQFAGIGIYLWELMRLDHEIHVINKFTGNLVNTFSIATASLPNPAGDVLDRSAWGSKMYATLRGFVPITAITAFPDLNRDPGVMTIKARWFGYTGKVTKVSSIRSQHGNTTLICSDGADGDNHDHSGLACLDVNGDPVASAVEVDAADPHGLKSLNYFTGF